MKNKFLLIVLLLIFITGCKAQNSKDPSVNRSNTSKIKIFFLAGQSNMEGRARAFNLTKEDKKRLEKAKKNVTLYYNHKKPVPLQVTTPAAHTQKKFGAEQMFGPELFFGIHLAEKYPNQKFIFIKRSKGGMSLFGAWNPNWTIEKAKVMKEDNDPKLYSDFISYAKEVLSGFDKDSYELCGMLWVQGETDSGKKKNGTIPADTYESNLKNLISGVRMEFHQPQLPFIIFQVGSGKVVKAMKNIAKDDVYVSLIPQSKDKNSELFFVRNPLPLGHYTYESMKKIGTLFFDYYEINYTK